MATFRPGILALAVLSIAGCVKTAHTSDPDLGPLPYRMELPAGVDPAAIRWEVPSATLVEIDRLGSLVLHTNNGRTRSTRPRVSQDAPAGRRLLDARFVLDQSGDLRLQVGPHDPARPLLIEPFTK